MRHGGQNAAHPRRGGPARLEDHDGDLRSGKNRQHSQIIGATLAAAGESEARAPRASSGFGGVTIYALPRLAGADREAPLVLLSAEPQGSHGDSFQLNSDFLWRKG